MMDLQAMRERAENAKTNGWTTIFTPDDVLPLIEALSAAQDEIERRISECESHRAVADAVLAEREAERQERAFSTKNRRIVVDSIGGA